MGRKKVDKAEKIVAIKLWVKQKDVIAATKDIKHLQDLYRKK